MQVADRMLRERAAVCAPCCCLQCALAAAKPPCPPDLLPALPPPHLCQVCGREGPGAAGEGDAAGACCGGHAAVGGVPLVIAAQHSTAGACMAGDKQQLVSPLPAPGKQRPAPGMHACRHASTLAVLACLKPPGRYQLELPPPVPQLSMSNCPLTPARSTTAQQQSHKHKHMQGASLAGQFGVARSGQ